MSGGKVIRLIALVDGDPLDIRTDSGRAPTMIREMARRGLLLKAVSTEPPRVLDNVLKVWSNIMLRRKRETWTAVHLHPLRRFASALIGRMKCSRLRGDANVWLQFGLMVDSGLVPIPESDFRCCLFDDNHVTFVKSRYYEPERMGRFDARLISFEKKVSREMDLVAAQSEIVRRSFIDDYGVDPDRVVNVRNGVNLHPLPGPPLPRSGPPVFLFIGGDFERKGGSDVLSAFSVVQAAIPQARLKIIGPEKNPVPDPTPGVEFLGYMSRATPEGETRFRTELSAATIFVMPSLREPLGNIYLEAMAFGLPCIGARVNAIPEIIDHGSTGLLVEPGDAVAVADAMMKLGQDPELANRMGRAGYDRVHAYFTWEHVVDELIAAIDRRLRQR